MRYNGNYDCNLYLYCPEPLSKSKYLNPVRPFAWNVWLAIVVSLFAMVVAAAIVEWIQRILLDGNKQSEEQNLFFLFYGVLFNEFR